MASKVTVRLACVPEQVNIPVDILKNLHIDEKYNFDIQVLTVPEGTGKMLDMLERGDADIAMTVSDAFIVANAKGRAVELVGTWVSSPLVWAVAASPSLPADIITISDLVQYRQIITGDPNCKLRIGISRPGSGSQTMATYMAMLHQLDYHNGLEFVVANNFDGLKKGIELDQFDLFLWETFTTKPDFDSKLLRKLDDICTPWPAFSLVMASSMTSVPSGNSLSLRTAILKGLFPALAESAVIFTENLDSATEQIVTKFGHQEADARSWLRSVQYNTKLLFSSVASLSVDEHKGQSVEDFKSVPSSLTLAPINRDIYVNSVCILQSIGLVPLEFNVNSLWPSWAFFQREDTTLQEYPSVTTLSPREVEAF